jgi:hypothetical protein
LNALGGASEQDFEFFAFQACCLESISQCAMVGCEPSKVTQCCSPNVAVAINAMAGLRYRWNGHKPQANELNSVVGSSEVT